MVPDEETAEENNISEPANTSFLLYGPDQNRAVLEALGQLHAAGNPLVLHEAIRRSQEYGLPLPEWAATALMDQEVTLLNDPKRGKMGRYKQSLKPHVRRRTYFSIMSWLKDARRYRGMPRSIIEKWYAGDIQHQDKKSSLTKSQRAFELALQALDGTFASCKEHNLRETIYEDPHKPQLKKIISGIHTFSDADSLEPDEGRGQKELKNLLREELFELTICDEWEIEGQVGLLKDFFGSPGAPPPHIKNQLDELDKSDGPSEIEGIFSED
jgi:hypothetical protein